MAVAGQWFYGSFPCGNSVPSHCILRVTDRAFQSRVSHCGTCLRAKSHRTQLAMSCCAQRVAPCTRRPPAAHCEPARRSCRERGATAVLATNATPHTHTPRRVTQTAACTSHASHQATAVAEQKRIHKTRRSRGCLSQPLTKAQQWVTAQTRNPTAAVPTSAINHLALQPAHAQGNATAVATARCTSLRPRPTAINATAPPHPLAPALRCLIARQRVACATDELRACSNTTHGAPEFESQPR